jgi:hypothetical protein
LRRRAENTRGGQTPRATCNGGMSRKAKTQMQRWHVGHLRKRLPQEAEGSKTRLADLKFGHYTSKKRRKGEEHRLKPVLRNG